MKSIRNQVAGSIAEAELAPGNKVQGRARAGRVNGQGWGVATHCGEETTKPMAQHHRTGLKTVHGSPRKHCRPSPPAARGLYWSWEEIGYQVSVFAAPNLEVFNLLFWLMLLNQISYQARFWCVRHFGMDGAQDGSTQWPKGGWTENSSQLSRGSEMSCLLLFWKRQSREQMLWFWPRCAALAGTTHRVTQGVTGTSQSSLTQRMSVYYWACRSFDWPAEFTQTSLFSNSPSLLPLLIPFSPILCWNQMEWSGWWFKWDHTSLDYMETTTWTFSCSVVFRVLLRFNILDRWVCILNINIVLLFFLFFF